MDYQSSKKVLVALEREKVQYVVFGGAAINLLGLPRYTIDLDLFIAPDLENIEQLKAALRSVFHDPNIDQITAEDLLGEYPAVRYVPPEGEFSVDILTRLGSAFRFEDLETERIPFDEIMITVATPKTLYRMKKDTLRIKDRGDAELLRKRFNIEEE
ncbi:MAG: hypothetical protein EHM45_05915 [Desulfobacteraceae bacterium]|nr:MAG: hypothetical protein EHM45_05915 [Desulfobacteraceae bacterium]